MVSNNIGKIIDAYAAKNTSQLRREESRTGRKMTKYDVAAYMLSHGALKPDEMNAWIKTQEGVATRTESERLKNLPIFMAQNQTHGKESYLDQVSEFSISNVLGFEKTTGKNGQVHYKKKRIEKRIDVNKELQQRRMMDKVRKSPKPIDNRNVLEMTREIEAQEETKKLSKMTYDEQKNYIMSKFMKAWYKKDIDAMVSTLGEFYGYECEVIDKKLGITGSKEFLKDKSGLRRLVDKIDKLLDDGNNKNLSVEETAWEVIKGFGDTLNDFISVQGIMMIGSFGAAGKLAKMYSKVGPLVAKAIQAYFGIEGSKLIFEGGEKIIYGETKEEIRQGGANLSMGGIMVSGAKKSFNNAFKPKTKKTYVAPKTDPHSDIIAKKVEEAVKPLRKEYSDSKDFIDEKMKKNGLSGIGDYKSRVKKETSLRDKVYNSFRKDIKKGQPATMNNALSDIRDAYGGRTIIKTNVNYTKHPEVAALIKAGDVQEAMFRAAELQSEPVIVQIKKMIDLLAIEEGDFEITRIVNYVSKDGIPYLSENQLSRIAHHAYRKNIKNIDQVIRIENNKIVDANGEEITKNQPSGYTALQMNLKTKDGKIFEWQFRGNKVNKFAEGEHIPYDLRTGKDILGDHPELEPLYRPLQEMLRGVGEEKIGRMPDNAFQEYNRYLNNYYTYLRKTELGFEAKEPKLSEYGNGYKFDPKLEAENLIRLNEIAEQVKNGDLSVNEAIERYNRVSAYKKEQVDTKNEEFLSQLSDNAKKRYKYLFNSEYYKNLSTEQKYEVTENFKTLEKLQGFYKSDYTPELPVLKQKIEFVMDSSIKSYLETEIKNIEKLPKERQKEKLLELDA